MEVGFVIMAGLSWKCVAMATVCCFRLSDRRSLRSGGPQAWHVGCHLAWAGLDDSQHTAPCSGTPGAHGRAAELQKTRARGVVVRVVVLHEVGQGERARPAVRSEVSGSSLVRGR